MTLTDIITAIGVLAVVMIMAVLFKVRIRIKGKHGEIDISKDREDTQARATINENKPEDFPGGIPSPHATCPYRYDLAYVIERVKTDTRRIDEISLFETKTQQMRYAERRFKVYLNYVTTRFKTVLKEVHGEENPTESHEFRYFKLLLDEIKDKLLLEIRGFIENNGFEKYFTDPLSFVEYKKQKKRELEAILTETIDMKYIGKRVVSRDEVSHINNYNSSFDDAVMDVLDKLLELSSDQAMEIKRINKDLLRYLQDKIGLDIMPDANQEGRDA